MLAAVRTGQPYAIEQSCDFLIINRLKSEPSQLGSEGILIVVKCKDLRPVMAQLAAHVAEQVGAMPALKKNEFVLMPPDDEEIEISRVAESIKDFLKTIRRDTGFAVTASDKTVQVTSLDGKEIGPIAGLEGGGFFTCQHCGRISFFEADNRDHEKMHYIGGA